MDRRIIRQRRDYLHRKAIETKQRLVQDRKRRIREAEDVGKPIPSELRRQEPKLRQEIKYDDAITRELGQYDAADDEYANAGIRDPRIALTTSRDPSSRLSQFVKELHLLFPNSQRINRGSYVVGELVEACRNAGMTDMIVAHEHRGEPDGLVICHLPYGPTAYFGVLNAVLRHDLPDVQGQTTVSEAYPHLIMHNFKTALGERVRDILKFLFPVPKPDSKRIVTFANQNDYVSVRHHVSRRAGPEINLTEVGPRFELRLYQIRLGTADMRDADVEWTLHPYKNNAKRAELL